MKLALVFLAVSLLESLDAERPSRAPVQLTFVSYSSKPDVIDTASTATTHVDAVWIGFQDARVRPAAACKGADTNAVVAGAFTLELVKRVATATETNVAHGRYCAFEVQLRRTSGRAAGAPSELKGASIVIEGRRSDGLRFAIRSRLHATVALRAFDLQGMSVPEGGARWIVGIDLARWFVNLDLADASVSDSPRGRTITIDEKHNSELLATFNANVDGGFGLYEDRDGDRSLDAEERARPIAGRQ